MKRLIAFLALFALPVCAEDVSSASGAVVRGLDKLSGELRDLTLSNGQMVSFGRLEITLSDCRYPSGNSSSNAYGYLTILDAATKTPVFRGWMVASSPALNALDHPRYDIWILRCSTS